MNLRVSKVLPIFALSLSPGLVFGQTQAGTSSAGEIYKKAGPSVVLIEVYDLKGDVSKAGTGFLVSPEGAILTNYHVIAHSKQATIRLANNDAYDTVEVLDIDKRKDIALIKIKGSGLPHLPLGHSSAVEIGDLVFSLSNPLGVFQNTLSQGMVSGIRQGDGYRYFQITAPISPGSSGGPIFNGRGEVIGIAVASVQEGQNLNFAIPVDYARGMLSSNQPRPLASIYESRPEITKSEEARNTEGASSSGVALTSATPKPMVSEGMKKSSFWYLQSKLRIWTEEDARNELGDPIRHRFVRDNFNTINGDVYAYSDPTQLMREVELNFDSRTKRLQAVYGYTWDMTWEQCKKLWGENVTTTKNHDGTRFYAYRDRNLLVLTDKHGKVISIGVY